MQVAASVAGLGGVFRIALVCDAMYSLWQAESLVGHAWSDRHYAVMSILCLVFVVVLWCPFVFSNATQAKHASAVSHDVAGNSDEVQILSPSEET